jgi:cupin fold WbuC family metalloprotein
LKDYIKSSEEVVVSSSSLEKLNNQNIEYLVSKAKETQSNKFRLCCHETINDPVHEMFIVHPKDVYIRPHKHIKKAESILVLEGCMDYITFKDSGEIKERVLLGDYNSGNQFYIANKEYSFHSLIIYSDWCVFLEITKGPFIKDETCFAPWSAESKDKKGIKNFMKKYVRQF